MKLLSGYGRSLLLRAFEADDELLPLVNVLLVLDNPGYDYDGSPAPPMRESVSFVADPESLRQVADAMTTWATEAEQFAESQRVPATASGEPAAVAADLAAATGARAWSEWDQTGLVAAVNEARRREGLPELESDPALAAVSAGWAKYLAATQTLQHGAVASRIWTVHPGAATGEDIAVGQVDADAVVTAWLEEPAHRQILFGQFNRAGSAVAVSVAGDRYWVVDLAMVGG